MRNVPCHNCKDRFTGCHSSCQYYIDWRKEKDADNARKLKIYKTACDYSFFRRDCARKAKRRKNT